MTRLGKRLIRAAQEANAIAKGELDASTYRVRVPQVIDVQVLRKRLRMTQAEFAARFGIPVGTVRDWEQHRRRPDGATRVLLTVIDKEPEAVERALAGA